MEINFYPTRVRNVLAYGVVTLAAMFILATNNLANAALNGSYTIDKNSAASASNYLSFTALINDLSGLSRGDGGPSNGAGVSGPVTVNVTSGSGPYTEQISIPGITGTSATNTITINGNGQTIQYNATSSASMHVVKFDGVDYLRLNNLTIKSLSSSYGWGIFVNNASNYNRIENCTIDISSVTATTSSYSVGITFTGSATTSYGYTASVNGGTKGIGNVVKGNSIFGSSTNNGLYVGIALAGDYYNQNTNTQTLVENNTIRNFYLYGVYAYYHAGTTYTGNDIGRVQKTTYTTFYGFYNYYSTDCKFYANKVHSVCPTATTGTFSAYGIYNLLPTYVTATGEYANNLIDLRTGGYVYGIMAYYGSGHKIYHNTVRLRTTTGYYAYGIYAYDYTFSAVYDVKNNIVDVENSNSGYYSYNIYFYGSSITSNGNVLKRNAAYTYNYTGYIANTAQTTLTDWRGAQSGIDVNSVDVDPQFKNIATGDFEPTSIEVDGIGSNVSVAKDVKGLTRSAINPDPGCIEFDIPINVTAITFPTTVCQGAEHKVQVSIQNNSTLNLSNFKVIYEVNGVVAAREVFTSTINAGTSGSFTFAAPVVSNALGAYTLKAYVIGKPANVSIAYNVYPSPIGSIVTQGATFQGQFVTGNAADPDIVAHGDQLNYTLSAPTGFTNTQYGTAWTFDSWDMKTPGGTAAGSTHTKTNPASGNPANARFAPTLGQSDSTYVLRYAIRSLTNGCVAPAVERVIFVAPRPTAAFASSSVCQGSPAQFQNNTTISSGTVAYSWRFGDGDSSRLINPGHTYPSYGTYNVQLVARSNYGYTSTSAGTISIIENPVAAFDFVNKCAGTAIPFMDISNIPTGNPTYAWSFGDGITSVNPNPTHLYATPGAYEVTLTVNDHGCTGTAKQWVTQAPRATVSYTSAPAACNNVTVPFTNTSSLAFGTVGYTWKFGDGITSTDLHPKHAYSTFGSFNVTLKAITNFGCVDSFRTVVQLMESPVAQFAHSTLCNKESVVFTNGSSEPAGSGVNYSWVFGDGQTSGVKNPSNSYAATGTYKVQLTAVATNGCQDIKEMILNIGELPVADFIAEDVCQGQPVQLMNNSVVAGGLLTYDWDMGNATGSSLKNPAVVYAATGTYAVKLTVTTPQGCKGDVIKSVRVKEVPVISFTGQSALTGKGEYAFTPSSTRNDVEYNWLFGDGGRSTDKGIVTYRYLADGLYTVSLRVSKDGCSSVEKHDVSINRLGVDNGEAGKIAVYPNPSTGRFVISLGDLSSITTGIQVYAITGQLVKTIDLSGIHDAVAEVDMSNVAAGVYTVKVTTGQHSFQSKVTVNK